MPCRAAIPASHRNCSIHKTRGGIDEETLEIRAIEVTGSNIGPSHGLHANRCPLPGRRVYTPRRGQRMRQFCQIFWGRLAQIRRSAVSLRTALMTLANAMMRLSPATLIPSSRRAKTPSLGSLTHAVQGKETKLYAPPSISAVPFGDT